MTRDELLAMARVASGTGDDFQLLGEEIERFAALVAARAAAAEREACLDLLQNKQGNKFLDLGEVIAAIRARGEVRVCRITDLDEAYGAAPDGSLGEEVKP